MLTRLIVRHGSFVASLAFCFLQPCKLEVLNLFLHGRGASPTLHGRRDPGREELAFLFVVCAPFTHTLLPSMPVLSPLPFVNLLSPLFGRRVVSDKAPC